jgi:hypothetical protein
MIIEMGVPPVLSLKHDGFKNLLLYIATDPTPLTVFSIATVTAANFEKYRSKHNFYTISVDMVLKKVEINVGHINKLGLWESLFSASRTGVSSLSS